MDRLWPFLVQQYLFPGITHVHDDNGPKADLTTSYWFTTDQLGVASFQMAVTTSLFMRMRQRMSVHCFCSSQVSSAHASKKSCLLYPEIFSSQLVIPGLQNDLFPPIHAGFPSPEMALYAVKMLQELVLYCQLLGVFLIHIPVPLILKTLLLPEELVLLPSHHLLSDVDGEVQSQTHLAWSEIQPKQPLHIWGWWHSVVEQLVHRGQQQFENGARPTIKEVQDGDSWIMGVLKIWTSLASTMHPIMYSAQQQSEGPWDTLCECHALSPQHTTTVRTQLALTESTPAPVHY